jgi:hypothetical protein
MNTTMRWTGLGALAAVLVLGACSDKLESPFAPEQSASFSHVGPSQFPEQLYLSEEFSATPGVFGNGGAIYRVQLDDGAHQANLTLLVDLQGNCAANLPAGFSCTYGFDKPHIGATPDGSRVYVLNKFQSNGMAELPVPGAGNPLGYYDVATGQFVYVGQLAGLPLEGSVQVAFSPAGRMYVANQDSDRLYLINEGLTAVGPSWEIRRRSDSELVNVLGADIAFDAAGRLFLWTNSPPAGSGRLLEIEIDGGTAWATVVGQIAHPEYMTGLAVRGAGMGSLIASSVLNDHLWMIDPGTGVIDPAGYPMYLNGVRYEHQFGDMATGFLAPQAGCSHGFWKNHVNHWVGYSPNQTLGSVFDFTGVNPNTLQNRTLMQALNFGGGPGVQGAQQILLRNAVAALLNAAHPGVNYPLTTAQVIAMVNAALQSNDRNTMLALEAQLDMYNNLGCTLSGR